MKPSSMYFILAAVYLAPHVSKELAFIFGGAFTVMAVVMAFIER